MINDVIIIDRNGFHSCLVCDIHMHVIDMIVMGRRRFFYIYGKYFFATGHQFFRELSAQKTVAACNDMLQCRFQKTG